MKLSLIVIGVKTIETGSRFFTELHVGMCSLVTCSNFTALTVAVINTYVKVIYKYYGLNFGEAMFIPLFRYWVPVLNVKIDQILGFYMFKELVQ